MRPSEELSRRIEVIESGYEYLLAYAAQGRQNEAGSEARQRLSDMHAALGDLAEIAARDVAGSTGDHDVSAYLDAVREDARRARGAVALVLSRPVISSLLVDNLNASIHVRALLTDIFLLEQALKTG